MNRCPHLTNCWSPLPILLAVAALAACDDSIPTTNDAPVIASFGAFPASVQQGTASALKWEISGATILTIDHGVGLVTGLTEKAVTPTLSTTYTMTAEGPGGTSTATALVTVTGLKPPPVISAFGASPPSIGLGSSSTLSWTVANAATLSINQGVGPVTNSSGDSGSKVVTPSATTTYTLTAIGTGGTVQATALVTVGAAGLRLDYQDPMNTAGKKLLLVRNPGSTNARLLLDVKVGAAALTGFGVAMNLPLDHTKATFTSATGLIIPNTGPLLPGVGAGAAMGGKAMTSGPLADFLTVGVARKKSSASDTDVNLPAGTVLFQLAFDLVTSPDPANGALFDGASLPPKAKLSLLLKDGTEAASTADFAVGQLYIRH